MSKATELTVIINAKLDVDKKTAETCLALIEAFMNNHPDVEIMCTQLETGEREYRFYNKLSEEENDDV